MKLREIKSENILVSVFNFFFYQRPRQPPFFGGATISYGEMGQTCGRWRHLERDDIRVTSISGRSVGRSVGQGRTNIKNCQDNGSETTIEEAREMEAEDGKAEGRKEGRKTLKRI